MSDNQEFINKILVKLNTKLSLEDLHTVQNIVLSVSKDYDITIKKTEVALYQGFPIEAKEYLVSKKLEGLSQSSLDIYYYHLKKFFEYIHKPIKDITKVDVQFYLYNYEQNKNLSPAYLENIRSVICIFFEWLTYNDYLDKNPCKSIKPLKLESTREPLTDIEIKSLRNMQLSLRDKAILEVMYSTGCRVSELINIKVNDINLVNRQISVVGKGNKPRKVFLNVKAYNSLCLYLNSNSHIVDYVFISSRKPYTKLSVRCVEDVISRMGKKANIISRVFPHRIRHTTATKALKNGMPLEYVKVMLGHKSVDTTLIYTKINSNDVQLMHQKTII